MSRERLFGVAGSTMRRRRSRSLTLWAATSMLLLQCANAAESALLSSFVASHELSRRPRTRARQLDDGFSNLSPKGCGSPASSSRDRRPKNVAWCLNTLSLTPTTSAACAPQLKPDTLAYPSTLRTKRNPRCKRFFGQFSSCYFNRSPADPRIAVQQCSHSYSERTLGPAAEGGWSKVEGGKEQQLRSPPQSLIRNFCLIAHVDHGKSTLADRLLEFTECVPKWKMRDRILDSMELERERGITIKLRGVRIQHRGQLELTRTSQHPSEPKREMPKVHILNMIDTPGHADFSGEVSRSLAACEGAVLLVDATQGVEAQTVLVTKKAKENGLTLIPAITKIDHLNARIDEAVKQTSVLTGVPEERVLRISGKTGEGVTTLLDALVERVPGPNGSADSPLRIFVFDSAYDPHLGVLLFCKVINGTLGLKSRVAFQSNGKEFVVERISHLSLLEDCSSIHQLGPGDVGVVRSSLRDPTDVAVGDNLVMAKDLEVSGPIPQEAPRIFACLFPREPSRSDSLRGALTRLGLSDPAFTFVAEESAGLGLGYRCGFLGPLHLEITRERLAREYNESDILVTPPSVEYRCLLKNGLVLDVSSPSKWPSPAEISNTFEPYANVRIQVPHESVGRVLRLCQERRGQQICQEAGNFTTLTYKMPLQKAIDQLDSSVKSVSRGFGETHFTFSGYEPSKIVKLDVRINGKLLPQLSRLVHYEDSHTTGKELTQRLRDAYPRQQFLVKIQSCIGSKVLASSQLSPFRKDATAKCYGGDISRKRKLLAKQSSGKKRLRDAANIQVPPEMMKKLFSAH